MIKTCFTVLAMSFVSIGYAQLDKKSFDYKITYQLTFIKDSTNQEQKAKEFLELLISDSLVVFQSYNRALNDSIAEDEKRKLAAWNAAGSRGNYEYQRPITTDFSYKIYQKDGQKWYTEGLQDRVTYAYQEKDEISWELTSETAIVSGYTCQKAQARWSNRSWEAWFTMDVPLTQGPYFFDGLPGLIVSLQDATASYIFELAKIERGTESLNKHPWSEKNFKIVEKKDFYKTKKYLRDHAFDLFQASSSYYQSNPEKLKEARDAASKKARANNNWIELFP